MSMPQIRQWLKQNLFNTRLNALLSILTLCLLGWVVSSLGVWIFTQAQWAAVQGNMRLFLVGRYPLPQLWRLQVLFGLWAIIAIASPWILPRSWQRHRPWILAGTMFGFGISLWLIGGGIAGLTLVRTSLWNGLLLTLLMAIVSIGLSFPLGIALALGRQSPLPVIQWGCTAYIELIRGLPLVGILFLAQVMLPLLLPTGVRPDRVLRAIIGLTLFSAAYLAENVRGGLQAIPPGQVEAAKSLGLSGPLVTLLIVLPQALRVSIPAIVGQFIGLFKDTSLLSLFALVELTGISRTILAQPQFIGRYPEVYLFIGFVYWIFCYGLSWAGRRIETTGSTLYSGNRQT